MLNTGSEAVSLMECAGWEGKLWVWMKLVLCKLMAAEHSPTWVRVFPEAESLSSAPLACSSIHQLI